MGLFWIPADGIRLAIMPRPRGHDWLAHDIALLHQAGVEVVVSALTFEEVEELGLAEEEQHCRAVGLEFVSFPIEDRSIPQILHDYDELIALLDDRVSAGRGV